MCINKDIKGLEMEISSPIVKGLGTISEKLYVIGYREGIDCVRFRTNTENHIIGIRYSKSIQEEGQEDLTDYYNISIPDRYVNPVEGKPIEGLASSEVHDIVKGEGIFINANIKCTLLIIAEILGKIGYREGVDCLKFETNFRDQYSQIKYQKSIKELVPGEEPRVINYYTVIIPDRYVISTQDSIKNKNVVRNIHELNELLAKSA